MTYDTNHFLDQLRQRVTENVAVLDHLATLPREALHLRPRPEAWTALEALAHINKFDRAYQRQMERALGEQRYGPSATFRSGWLGRVVANWARPGAKTIKLWAPKSMNFKRQEIRPGTLDDSKDYSARLLALIERARGEDLTRVRVATIEVSWIKLRLGDVLHLLANHDWRHIEQAERATRGLAGIRTS